VKVTMLGTGTSGGVPLIGCQCEVCTSSNEKDNRLRSSIFIELDDFNFIIDTGPDFRYQMLRSNVSRLDAVVFTHEHKDHTGGLDDIRAFNFLQQKEMQVYASDAVQLSLKQSYHYIFSENNYFGIPKVKLNTIKNEPFNLGGKTIIPIEVLHYKLPVLGFRIDDFTYITDANFISNKELSKVVGTKTLVLNALRHKKHISHFTLNEAIEIAQTINAENTYFTHISHQLGLHKTIEKELPENIYLAYDGLTLNF